MDILTILMLMVICVLSVFLLSFFGNLLLVIVQGIFDVIKTFLVVILKRDLEGTKIHGSFKIEKIAYKRVSLHTSIFFMFQTIFTSLFFLNSLFVPEYHILLSIVALIFSLFFGNLFVSEYRKYKQYSKELS